MENTDYQSNIIWEMNIIFNLHKLNNMDNTIFKLYLEEKDMTIKDFTNIFIKKGMDSYISRKLIQEVKDKNNKLRYIPTEAGFMLLQNEISKALSNRLDIIKLYRYENNLVSDKMVYNKLDGYKNIVERRHINSLNRESVNYFFITQLKEKYSDFIINGYMKNDFSLTQKGAELARKIGNLENNRRNSPLIKHYYTMLEYSFHTSPLYKDVIQQFLSLIDDKGHRDWAKIAVFDKYHHQKITDLAENPLNIKVLKNIYEGNVQYEMSNDYKRSLSKYNDVTKSYEKQKKGDDNNLSIQTIDFLIDLELITKIEKKDKKDKIIGYDIVTTDLCDYLIDNEIFEKQQETNLKYDSNFNEQHILNM